MMVTCEDARRLIADSQDRRLGLMERIGLRMHLMMCGVCPFYERQLSILRGVMSRRTGIYAERGGAAVPTLSSDARERIREAIKQGLASREK